MEKITLKKNSVDLKKKKKKTNNRIFDFFRYLFIVLNFAFTPKTKNNKNTEVAAK